MGSDKPTVLPHAWLRSGKMIENFGKMLAKIFFVIIPDLPGYGFSEVNSLKISNLCEVISFMKSFKKDIQI